MTGVNPPGHLAAIEHWAKAQGADVVRIDAWRLDRRDAGCLARASGTQAILRRPFDGIAARVRVQA